MSKDIARLHRLIRTIAWQFGDNGFNESECYADLSFVEFMALVEIEANENFSIQEIGNALGFTKSGATRVVDRLEKKGHVVRKQSALDGRVCCVVVTPEGRDVVTIVTEYYISQLQNALQVLEPREIGTIVSALETLVAALRL